MSTIKDDVPVAGEPGMTEKAIDTGAPAERIISKNESVVDPFRNQDFMTRNGLNFESFKPAIYGRGIVNMEQSMSTRHMHMIAIGGSIGAGFFVGSGRAFYNGVCDPSPRAIQETGQLISRV